MTEPPIRSPRMISGWTRLNALTTGLNKPDVGLASYMCGNKMMMPKTIVVAPTTAVPISTGLAVALKVLPAPSFSSRNSLPFSKFGSKPKSFLISA